MWRTKKLKKAYIGGVTMIEGYLAVGLCFLIFSMMESILLEHFFGEETF